MDGLHWEASYEIVLALKQAYPALDLDTLGYQQLYEKIIALPGFADDPTLVNESILQDILREWVEEDSA